MNNLIYSYEAEQENGLSLGAGGHTTQACDHCGSTSQDRDKHSYDGGYYCLEDCIGYAMDKKGSN